MLDPQRIGLNAASVGFLTRTGQKVDWASFNKALQTDDSGVCNVTAEMRTPVDELHVMGGQRFGLEGNVNLKQQERQERQMRGYPLRSFSADNPVIILPDKFGGLPLYTRNQTEYRDFCSSFTAPMSLPLQNDTVLLGREGYSVSNDSASKPFEPLGFEMNMHKSSAAIDYNEAILQQRKYIMGKRSRQGMNSGQVTGGSRSNPGTIRGSGLAIGVGARGRPEFGENADAQALLQKSFENEGLYGDMAEETAFEMSKQQRLFQRQRVIGKRGLLENEVARPVQNRIAHQVLAHRDQPELGMLEREAGGNTVEGRAARAVEQEAQVTPANLRRDGPRYDNQALAQSNGNQQRAGRAEYNMQGAQPLRADNWHLSNRTVPGTPEYMQMREAYRQRQERIQGIPLSEKLQRNPEPHRIFQQALNQIASPLKLRGGKSVGIPHAVRKITE